MLTAGEVGDGRKRVKTTTEGKNGVFVILRRNIARLAGLIATASAALLGFGVEARATCGGENLMTRMEAEAPAEAAALRAAAEAQPDGEGRFWKIEKDGLPLHGKSCQTM